MNEKTKSFRRFWEIIKDDISFYMGEQRLRVRSLIANLIFNPSLQLILLYRCCHFFYIKKWTRLTTIFEWLQLVIFCSRIEKRAQIGSHFKIAHPTGIIIGLAKIGNNVTVWQNVTIGASGRPKEKGRYPIIEDDVKIFANAVVAGDIRVGKRAVVGALSFLNIDVPPGKTAVGIPARIKGLP